MKTNENIDKIPSEDYVSEDCMAAVMDILYECGRSLREINFIADPAHRLLVVAQEDQAG